MSLGKSVHSALRILGEQSTCPWNVMENPTVQSSSSGGESILPKIQPWPSTEALDTTLPWEWKISRRCNLNLVPKELPHRWIRGVPQNKAPEGGSFVIDGRETLRKKRSNPPETANMGNIGHWIWNPCGGYIKIKFKCVTGLCHECFKNILNWHHKLEAENEKLF